MNGVPLKLDYSKTINEQIQTFEYYKDRYKCYELQILQLLKEVSELTEIIDDAKRYNKEIVGVYKDKDCMEKSNAETNLIILKDKDYIDVLKERG